MKLRLLLLIHAVLTLAAGIALILVPASILSTIDVHISSDAHIMCYLLGASEIAIAFLSYRARFLKNADAIKLIVQTFIVFHAITAALEIYAFSQGLNVAILANVMLRLIVISMFVILGLRITSLKS